MVITHASLTLRIPPKGAPALLPTETLRLSFEGGFSLSTVCWEALVVGAWKELALLGAALP